MAYAPQYLVENTGFIDWRLVKRAALRRARYYSIHDKPTRQELKASLEIIRSGARAEETRWCHTNGYPAPIYDRRALVPALHTNAPAPRRTWA